MGFEIKDDSNFDSFKRVQEGPTWVECFKALPSLIVVEDPNLFKEYFWLKGLQDSQNTDKMQNASTWAESFKALPSRNCVETPEKFKERIWVEGIKILPELENKENSPNRSVFQQIFDSTEFKPKRKLRKTPKLSTSSHLYPQVANYPSPFTRLVYLPLANQTNNPPLDYPYSQHFIFPQNISPTHKQPQSPQSNPFADQYFLYNQFVKQQQQMYLNLATNFSLKPVKQSKLAMRRCRFSPTKVLVPFFTVT